MSDQKNDFGEETTQNIFLSNLKDYQEIIKEVNIDRRSPDKTVREKYSKEGFFQAIRTIRDRLSLSETSYKKNRYQKNQSIKVIRIILFIIKSSTNINTFKTILINEVSFM